MKSDDDIFINCQLFNKFNFYILSILTKSFFVTLILVEWKIWNFFFVIIVIKIFFIKNNIKRLVIHQNRKCRGIQFYLSTKILFLSQTNPFEPIRLGRFFKEGWLGTKQNLGKGLVFGGWIIQSKGWINGLFWGWVKALQNPSIFLVYMSGGTNIYFLFQAF